MSKGELETGTYKAPIVERMTVTVQGRISGNHLASFSVRVGSSQPRKPQRVSDAAETVRMSNVRPMRRMRTWHKGIALQQVE